MKLDPINLIGGFYQDDNLPWSAQDTVNWIPRPAEMPGTISQMKLAGAPGLELLVQIDDEPVRIGGFRNVEGRMFIVAGTTLYELNTDLTTTVRGTIPGAGPVTMAHNQLEFGNELSIGNGSGSLYVWNTWTSTFTVVSDDAATGSIQSVYLNRRIIHLDPFGRFGYPSDIDSATSYDSLDRFDSEASPDKLVGLGVSQFELVALSQRTTEFYSITDATEQPFRPKRIAINRGCASRNSIVQLGGTLAWLGDDGIFYRLQGYEAVPISTGPVNKAIAGNNWANCFGFVYEDRKHEIAYWTFPDGQTWGYDAWTGLIHRRESFGLNRWRINAIEKWNDMWIAGDFQSGRIYRIDWDTYHENGQPLVAMRTAPPIYNNGNEVVCPMIDLVFDTGRGSLPAIGLSGNLPDGVYLESGTYQYTASGGIAPLTFSIVSGALPTGATLDSGTGLVTYTYTNTGAYSWTVRVTDAFGQSANVSDSAVISGVPFNVAAWTGDGAPTRNPFLQTNLENGGLVWSKSINATGEQTLDYSLDGITVNRLLTSSADSATPSGTVFDQFGATFVTQNASAVDYVGVAISKSPGLMDVVTYTGTGSAHTIPHALGSVPGAIIIKRIDGTSSNWVAYHQGFGNTTGSIAWASGLDADATLFNNTSPTISVFTVGTSTTLNAVGAQYVAFVFANNSDINCVSCPNVTSNANSGMTFIPMWSLCMSAGQSSIIDSLTNERYLSQWKFTRPETSSQATQLTGSRARVFAPRDSGFEYGEVGSGAPNIGLTGYIALRDIRTVTEPATWNPDDAVLGGFTNIALSNGDRTAAIASGVNIGIRSRQWHNAGKWYCEMLVGPTNNTGVGLATYFDSLSAGNIVRWVYIHNGKKGDANGEVAYGAAYAEGDVIGIKYDGDAKTIEFLKNNVSQGVAFTGIPDNSMFAAAFINGAATMTSRLSASEFQYPIPSGYEAWS